MDDSFDIEFVRGKIVAHWDWTFEIPLFKIVERVGKSGWNKRLEEELEKIEFLKKLMKKNIYFDKIEQDPKNPRIFYVEGKSELNEKIKFILRLPIQYPFVPPLAEEYYYQGYSYSADPKYGRVACLDKINNRWNKEGRHGIAHFLAMLGYYTALARHNVNLRSLKLKKKPKSRGK